MGRAAGGRKRGREAHCSEAYGRAAGGMAGGSKRQRFGNGVAADALFENAADAVSKMDVDTDNDSWNTRSNSGSEASHFERSDRIVTDSVDSTFSDGYSLLPLTRVDSKNVTTVSTWLAPR